MRWQKDIQWGHLLVILCTILAFGQMHEASARHCTAPKRGFVVIGVHSSRINMQVDGSEKPQRRWCWGRAHPYGVQISDKFRCLSTPCIWSGHILAMQCSGSSTSFFIDYIAYGTSCYWDTADFGWDRIPQPRSRCSTCYEYWCSRVDASNGSD